MAKFFKIACECGHTVFFQKVQLIKTPGLMTGTGHDEIGAAITYYCENCEKPLEHFNNTVLVDEKLQPIQEIKKGGADV